MHFHLCMHIILSRPLVAGKKTTSLLLVCRLYSWCNDRSLKLLLNWFEIHLKIYGNSMKKKKLIATKSYTHFFSVLVSFVFLPFFRKFTIGWSFSYILPSFSCPSLSYSFSFISSVYIYHLRPRPSPSLTSISFFLVHLFLHQPRSPLFSDTTQIFPEKCLWI